MSRKTDSRATILVAAETVVVESGAAHLTLDAVAAKAGISKGGLLYHFPSKEALLQGMLAILLEQCDADEEEFRAELGPSSTADLEAFVHTAFKEQASQRQIAAALLAAGANDPKLLAPVREWHLRNYRKMVVTKKHPIRAAVVMMALDGVWLNNLLQTSPLSSKERKELLEELLKLTKSSD